MGRLWPTHTGSPGSLLGAVAPVTPGLGRDWHEPILARDVQGTGVGGLEGVVGA